MNTRQKKKHDYFFGFINGLQGYNRHRFTTHKRKKLWNARTLRDLYKNNEYFIDWPQFPDEWFPENYI